MDTNGGNRRSRVRRKAPPRRNIPLPVIERLAKYYMFAGARRRDSVDRLSSAAIAQVHGLTCSTVRQDLSHLDYSGKAKVGYETRLLERALADTLGIARPANVAIVGAGNLGKALTLHGGFARSGFRIRAIFDSDPSLLGKKVGNLRISSMRDLGRIVRAQRIDIGVIAVPEAAAQDVADQLTRAGVKGLLNLAERPIRAPEGIHTQDVRIVAGLLTLLCQMRTGAR